MQLHVNVVNKILSAHIRIRRVVRVMPNYLPAYLAFDGMNYFLVVVVNIFFRAINVFHIGMACEHDVLTD